MTEPTAENSISIDRLANPAVFTGTIQFGSMGGYGSGLMVCLFVYM